MGTILLAILAVVLLVVLIFVPAAILDELKKQGRARAEEAARIERMLARACGAAPAGAGFEESLRSARLQAAIDASGKSA